MLDQYVIYMRPKDYPDHFVLRRWRIDVSGYYPDGDVKLAPTLAAAREHLPPGLFNLGRMPADDPVIVEVWV